MVSVKMPISPSPELFKWDLKGQDHYQQLILDFVVLVFMCNWLYVSYSLLDLKYIQ